MNGSVMDREEMLGSSFTHVYVWFDLQYDKPGTHTIPDSLMPLLENVDVVVNLAERHYYNCDFQECFRITSR